MGSFNEIMRTISSYQILGMIPLDLVLHALIGMIWTIVGLKKDFSIKVVFIGLIALALGKECYDYFFHYQTVWTEYASDFAVTLVYIVILFVVRKAKRSIEAGSSTQERWDLYD